MMIFMVGNLLFLSTSCLFRFPLSLLRLSNKQNKMLTSPRRQQSVKNKSNSTCFVCCKRNEEPEADVASSINRIQFSLFCTAPYHKLASMCFTICTHTTSLPEEEVVVHCLTVVIYGKRKALHIEDETKTIKRERKRTAKKNPPIAD